MLFNASRGDTPEPPETEPAISNSAHLTPSTLPSEPSGNKTLTEEETTVGGKVVSFSIEGNPSIQEEGEKLGIIPEEAVGAGVQEGMYNCRSWGIDKYVKYLNNSWAV